MPAKGNIRKAIPALALAVCFFTGVLTGYGYNDLTAGILIGLGSGFFAMGMLRFLVRSNGKDSPEEK